MELKGIFAAAVTPWGPGDRIDEAALWRQVEMLLATGLDGLCVGGTTGESVRLEAATHERLLRAALEMAAGRVPVLVGAAGASLDGTLALLHQARGATAALVSPPYYFSYGQSELLAFYREVVQQAKLPVFLYNIPRFTNRLEPATAIALLTEQVCAGIKDSSGSLEMLEALGAERRRTPFVFFCGADEYLVRALEMGADGAVSGIAACAPELLVSLYRAARAGDTAAVAQAQELLMEFIGWLDAFPLPVGIRLGLEARGIAVGRHAVPLAPETEQRARQFRRWFEEWLPRSAAVSVAGRP